MMVNIVLVGDETPDGVITDVQHALVRRDLPVSTLIERTLRTFAKAKELDVNSNYTFSIKDEDGERRVISPEGTFEGEGLKDGVLIYMGYEAQQYSTKTIRLTPGVREALINKPVERVRLHLQAFHTHNGRRAEFSIAQDALPAIIGRRPFDEKYGAVTVDLTDLEDTGDRRVSRAHARLLEENGVVKIESLRDTNPIRLGDRTVAYGIRYTLHSGDIISLGLISLKIELVGS